MATAEQVKALIRSHTDGDNDRFYSVALQVAAGEARQGHGRIAQEIRALIDKAASRPLDSAATPLHIAAPQGELQDLLSVSHPQVRLSDMVIEKQLASRMNRILNEQRHLGRIRAHGLKPRQKLLLVGPPGSGKTMTAAAMAGELGIPLCVVRLDALVTKYLGETSTKLRLIFEAINSTRAVYLFDEFDSIGTQRGAGHDVGEMRRVLNTFLTLLEEMHSMSLVLAATNYPDSLDHALFRRFDDLFEYALPDSESIDRMLHARLAAYENSELNFRKLVTTAKGLSFAEVARACEEAAKDMVIHQRETLATSDVVEAIRERKQLRQRKRPPSA
jgi:SpoVK/Ycf46/Vps4 family AAA+-type ATPase